MLLRSPAVITVQLEGITSGARKSSIRLGNSFHPAALMTLGELQLLFCPGGRKAHKAAAMRRVKMDELSSKGKACARSRFAGSFLQDEADLSPKANPTSFSGGAEIIKLDPEKLRPKRSKPNDAPNVPIDEHIGRHLKAIYDDVLKQPIPDRFLELLNQLGNEPSQEEDHQ